MQKLKLKRWLLVLVALLMAAILAGSSCFGGQAEKPTIKFSDTMYEASWLANAVAEFIIENGYGYPVETVELTVAVSQTSLSNGDIDVWLDTWWWYYLTWYDSAIENGEIENLGPTMEPAPSFWTIPQWVHEEYNINTVEDMKEHWELFQDPEDPSKGLFINCPIGWQCQEVNSVKLEAYGLTEYYNKIEPSAGALEAAMAGAQKRDEPVFGYYWAPTALMGMYDWYILEEPEYDPEVWDNILAAIDDDSLRPLDEACAYEAVSPANTIWSGLRDKAPDLIPLLENMNIGLENTNQAAAWAKENEIEDWETVGVWYLRTYEDRWQNWVSDDVYNKVKDALDEYGPVP